MLDVQFTPFQAYEESFKNVHKEFYAVKHTFETVSVLEGKELTVEDQIKDWKTTLNKLLNLVEEEDENVGKKRGLKNNTQREHMPGPRCRQYLPHCYGILNLSRTRCR